MNKKKAEEEIGPQGEEENWRERK
jgi:hypothetical protein